MKGKSRLFTFMAPVFKIVIKKGFQTLVKICRIFLLRMLKWISLQFFKDKISVCVAINSLNFHLNAFFIHISFSLTGSGEGKCVQNYSVITNLQTGDHKNQRTMEQTVYYLFMHIIYLWLNLIPVGISNSNFIHVPSSILRPIQRKPAAGHRYAFII